MTLLEDINELGVQTFERVNSTAEMLRADAGLMRDLARMVKPLPCEPERQRVKQDIIDLWHTSATHIDTAVDLIERGPMTDSELVKMIYDMLVNQCGAGVAMERARNISQALQGRVAREPETMVSPLTVVA